MDEARRWRIVVLLLGAAIAVLTVGALLLAGVVWSLLHELLSDDFLFFLGLVLLIPLGPAVVLPVVGALALWLQFARLLRNGPQGREGPRLVALLVVLGGTLVLTGLSLRDMPHGVPILLGGLVISACAGAAWYLAASAPRPRRELPVRSAPQPAADNTPPAAPAVKHWTWHVDLTRRGERR